MKVGDKAPEVLGINEKEKKYALPITKEKSWCFTSTRKTILRAAPLRRAIKR
jgi:hypothetical protein